jgi:hypothetical protein
MLCALVILNMAVVEPPPPACTSPPEAK